MGKLGATKRESVHVAGSEKLMLDWRSPKQKKIGRASDMSDV
jgi:hypothetical protein